MKKNLLLLLLLFLPLAASAYSVEIDGIYYDIDITNPNQKNVGVISNPNTYTGDVVIPERVTYGRREYTVTYIEKFAFNGCGSLTSVTIPNSVTVIGDDAFYGCGSLTSVHISDIAAWCSIDFKNYISNPLYYAHRIIFNGEEVKDLVIPNNVISIGDYAFFWCSSLTSVTIPNSVISIGNDAFQSCSGLTSITIGNSVTSIDSYAFAGCSGLASVTIPNSVTSIGEGAFCGCSGLTSITIPNGVTSIGDCTFEGCSGLTSVTIPNSVTSIGHGAFGGCSGLTSVTIPNSVKSIGDYAFVRCSGLTSVTIPNSVISIGNYAFSNCFGLTSVTIGSGVRTIDSEAFAYCSKLTDVYCHAENVPSTNANAFKESYIENSTLHVPAASVSAYQSAEPWKNFKSIVATQKCATPTISYANGKLTFDCETENVEFVSEITSSDFNKHYGSEVSLTCTYLVSVYATKAGYEDSKVATMEISVEGGGGLKGDVNGDGEVGIGDIISITNIMSIRP